MFQTNVIVELNDTICESSQGPEIMLLAVSVALPPGNARGYSKTKSGSDLRPVCRFHLQGTCKFGCSGNGCNSVHPLLCRNFLRRGSNGCKRADKCKFVHPKLCKASLLKGSCGKRKCYLYHCTGSKRLNFKPMISPILEQKKAVKEIQLEPKVSSLPSPALPKRIPIQIFFGGDGGVAEVGVGPSTSAVATA